jgi:predicted exporter
MSQALRRTRILATLGPATVAPGVILALIYSAIFAPRDDA